MRCSGSAPTPRSAITGVAGPGGGTEGKPVGTVCFSVALAAVDLAAALTRTTTLPGGRSDVRERSTTVAMHLLRRTLIGGGYVTGHS